MAEIRACQREDEVCRQVMAYCLEGWPTFPSLPGTLKPYWQVQNELTIQQGLLLKGVKPVIPSCMTLEMLDKLHEGHQGVVPVASQVIGLVARAEYAARRACDELHSVC